MPSRLGPKSPRVTNANHEIDKYTQVLKGGLLSILNLTQSTRWIYKFEGWLALNFESHSTHKMDFANWINHSLREGWRVFSRLKNM